ncbi:MAG: WbqC family protein [Sphingomonadales bacterium]
MLVLPSAYFPSLAYVRVLLNKKECTLDYNEHFIKQSIRTRCEILTSNGTLQLNIPVIHNGKQALSKVEIDYSKNWHADHLRAIASAYANAPHFDYYYYDLQQLFLLRPQYLITFNEAILNWIDNALGLELEIKWSQTYTGLINPDKKAWLGREWHPTDSYTQVFNERTSFVPNLSVIDGLMNEGPLLRRHFLPS